MTGWRYQVLERALKAHVPFAGKLRHTKRRLFGYRPDKANIDSTIRSFQSLMELTNKCGVQLQNSTILEMGSGWFPIIPICLLLAGAKEVFLSDIVRRIDAHTFGTARNIVKEKYDELATILEWPDFARDRLETISLDDFVYLAPFDLRAIPGSSLDFVFSRTVLEHIPLDDLSELLGGLREKLKSDGYMAHIIDNSDHYEHHDKSISRINFLTWSKRKHQFLYRIAGNNGENRLRHYQYVELFQDLGYRIEAEDRWICEKTLRLLPSAQLAHPYRTMDPREVATLTSSFAVRVGNLVENSGRHGEAVRLVQ